MGARQASHLLENYISILFLVERRAQEEVEAGRIGGAETAGSDVGDEKQGNGSNVGGEKQKDVADDELGSHRKCYRQRLRQWLAALVVFLYEITEPDRRCTREFVFMHLVRTPGIAEWDCLPSLVNMGVENNTNNSEHISLLLRFLLFTEWQDPGNGGVVDGVRKAAMGQGMGSDSAGIVSDRTDPSLHCYLRESDIMALLDCLPVVACLVRCLALDHSRGLRNCCIVVRILQGALRYLVGFSQVARLLARFAAEINCLAASACNGVASDLDALSSLTVGVAAMLLQASQHGVRFFLRELPWAAEDLSLHAVARLFEVLFRGGDVRTQESRDTRGNVGNTRKPRGVVGQIAEAVEAVTVADAAECLADWLAPLGPLSSTLRRAREDFCVGLATSLHGVHVLSALGRLACIAYPLRTGGGTDIPFVIVCELFEVHSSLF
jgi:hypothetical protein